MAYRNNYTGGGYEDGQSMFSPNKREGILAGGVLEESPEVSPEVPVDTFTPEVQANAETSQLPDNEMENEFVDSIVSKALDTKEEEYLLNALETDPRLNTIFDKVMLTASEFTGKGEVEGPGTGVSDSIPARLSDGEFVFTEQATKQLGPDYLQSLMDNAERAYAGGLQKHAFGGAVDSKESSLLSDEEDEIKKQMISANRMPSVV
jgi:hypothetical protein